MLNKPQEEKGDEENTLCAESNKTKEVSNNNFWEASSLKCDIEPLLSKNKLDSENVQDILNNDNCDDELKEDDEDYIQPPLNDDDLNPNDDNIVEVHFEYFFPFIKGHAKLIDTYYSCQNYPYCSSIKYEN